MYAAHAVHAAPRSTLQRGGGLQGPLSGQSRVQPAWPCHSPPVQIDVLDLKPRPNPGKGGKAYGWTGSPWW